MTPATTSAPAAATIPGFRSETVRVDGVRLHYWLGGNPDGPPVLLWHGFLSTGYAWHKVAPALADAGLCVLIPDMRGFGDSDKPEGDRGYDNRALAEEFRALVREIGFGAGRPLILAAHDMGAPPALIWAADHAEEVAALVHIEASVMLSEVLQEVIAYTPQAMAKGSMWWWILPLAPGIPERLVVGHERAFVTWFYEGATADPSSIAPPVVDEYLRTFSGREGALGAMGVYRAAFASIAQTEPLTRRKVHMRSVALGGSSGGLGAKVAEMLERVVTQVDACTWPDSGHFLPEERPDVVVEHILALATKAADGSRVGH